MKRLVSLFLSVCLLFCGICAFADSPPPADTALLGHWTINDYAEPWHDLFVTDDGVCRVNVEELSRALGGECSVSDASVRISLYGEDIRLAKDSPDVLLGGEVYTLDYPVTMENAAAYIELSDAGWLFYLELHAGADEDRETYSFDDEPVYFLSPDCGTELSYAQRGVVQGICAPQNTLLYLDLIGSATPTDEALAESYNILNPWAGLSHYENMEAVRTQLAKRGVTNRESLLAAVDALYDPARRTEFLSAAIKGQLDEGLTALFGKSFDPNTALLGWDLGQAALLAQWGYCVGYLDPMTAMEVSLDCAARLQNAFPDFSAYGQDCLLGYYYENGPGEAYDRLASVINALYGEGQYAGCDLGTPLPDADSLYPDPEQGDDAGDSFGFGVPDDYYNDGHGQNAFDEPDYALSARDLLPLVVMTAVLNGIGAVIGVILVIGRNRAVRRMRRQSKGELEPWNF